MGLDFFRRVGTDRNDIVDLCTCHHCELTSLRSRSCGSRYDGKWTGEREIREFLSKKYLNKGLSQ